MSDYEIKKFSAWHDAKGDNIVINFSLETKLRPQ